MKFAMQDSLDMKEWRNLSYGDYCYVVIRWSHG